MKIKILLIFMVIFISSCACPTKSTKTFVSFYNGKVNIESDGEVIVAYSLLLSDEVTPALKIKAKSVVVDNCFIHGGEPAIDTLNDKEVDND